MTAANDTRLPFTPRYFDGTRALSFSNQLSTTRLFLIDSPPSSHHIRYSGCIDTYTFSVASKEV